MFDRFTEDACRPLFFARVAVIERDGESIDATDLLNGLLMSAPDAVRRFAARPEALPVSAESPETFARRVLKPEQTLGRDPRLGREVAIAEDAKRVIVQAVEEADALGHQDVRPGHLLLGLLRDEGTAAWRKLHDAGVSLSDVRRVLADEDPGRR